MENQNRQETKDLKAQPLVLQLAHIQHELVAPKSQENAEAGFAYRNIEDILDAVKPLLATVGCVLSFSEEIEEHGGALYVASTATLTNAAGETFSTKALAREDDTLPGKCRAQITGSCISYARKYAAGGLLAIDAGKRGDIDDIAPSAIESQRKGEPLRTEARPILRGGMRGWSEEVIRLNDWKGTQRAHVDDLKTRYEIEERDLIILLSRRTAPFEDEKPQP